MLFLHLYLVFRSLCSTFFSVSVLAAENLLKQTQLKCGGVVSVPIAVLHAQMYLGELMFRRRIGKLRASSDLVYTSET